MPCFCCSEGSTVLHDADVAVASRPSKVNLLPPSHDHRTASSVSIELTEFPRMTCDDTIRSVIVTSLDLVHRSGKTHHRPHRSPLASLEPFFPALVQDQVEEDVETAKDA